MDFRSLIPALAPKGEEVAEEQQGPKGVKTLGPASLNRRYMTAGQVRRMRERERATQQRKANARYRRDFRKRQQHEANVRGQQAVLNGAGTDAMRANVLAGLERRYGNTEREEA